MFSVASRLSHLNVSWGNVSLHFILQLKRGGDAVKVEAVHGGLLRVKEVGPGELVEGCHGGPEGSNELEGSWKQSWGSRDVKW